MTNYITRQISWVRWLSLQADHNGLLLVNINQLRSQKLYEPSRNKRNKNGMGILH